MNNTLELIKILDAIDKNGSFEAAAQKLHKVRSALTYTIKKYEDRLGIQIFDRSEKKAQFTAAGRSLLNQGRELIKLTHLIEENVKQISTGWEPVIKIAYDVVVAIQPLFQLIKDFQKKSPATNLEIYSEVLGGCADALMSNRADIAIGVGQPLPSHADLIFIPMGKVKFVFVVAANHPLARVKEPLSSEQIKSYYAIAARDSSLHTLGLTSMLLSDQPRITFSNIEVKKQAQISGLGVGYLPYHLIQEEVKSKTLVIKQVERTQSTSDLYLGWNKRNLGKAGEWIVNQIQNKKFLQKLLK